MTTPASPDMLHRQLDQFHVEFQGIRAGGN